MNVGGGPKKPSAPAKRGGGGVVANGDLKNRSKQVANRFPGVAATLGGSKPNANLGGQPSLFALMSKSTEKARAAGKTSNAQSNRGFIAGSRTSPRAGRQPISSKLPDGDSHKSKTASFKPFSESGGLDLKPAARRGKNFEPAVNPAPNNTTTSSHTRDPLMVAMMKAKTRTAADEWAMNRPTPDDSGKPAQLGRFTRPTPGAMPENNSRGSLGRQMNTSPFADPLGYSTEESIERIRRRHRARKKLPKKLTETEVDVIVEELLKRRTAQEANEKMLDKIKVSQVLKLPDEELLEVMMALRDQSKDKSSGRLRGREDAGQAAVEAGGAPAAPSGTKFLPAVWSLPHGKIKPPGVYLDDNLVKTGMQHPVHAAKALLAAGPFGVGEAKACLDDLQAHLLSYYGKLFKIEPNLPLEYQLEQLSRNYYPSPAPLRGNLQEPHLSNQDDFLNAGRLPPPVRNEPSTGIAKPSIDRRDEAKTRIPSKQQNTPEKPEMIRPSSHGGVGRKKDSATNAAPGIEVKVSEASQADKQSGSLNGVKLPGEPEGLTRTATLPTVKRDVSGVMAELLDLAKGNGDRLTKMVKEVNDNLGDGSSVAFWRNERMRRDGLTCPKYLADAPYVEYLGDLESSVETMYRNLRITAEWNNRKIKLMEDRLKVLKPSDDRRSGL